MVKRKAVYRVLKRRGWLVHQRPCTPRPRVQGRVSQAARSHERWAMDVTHMPCGADGWAHLAAVIDGHDRELIGYEFSRRGRAKEAGRAVEAECLARFGALRPAGLTPQVRRDNGLIFQSRRFRAACRDDRVSQEFITPYTPEQNGLIERFFRGGRMMTAFDPTPEHSTHTVAPGTTIGDRPDPQNSRGEHRPQQEAEVA
jgi:putative transposase